MPPELDMVDRWVIQGNDAAASLATWARRMLPDNVSHTHRILTQALQPRYQACQTLLVNIGKQVVAEKEFTRAHEAAAWDHTRPSQPLEAEVVSIATLPADLGEPEHHTLGEGFTVSHTWLLNLKGGETAIPMWLSSYQLYAHFQWSTGNLGYHYNRKTKVYEPLTGRLQNEDYNFLRSAGWFVAMVKCFAHTDLEECNVQSRLPGTVFKSWQRCLLLRASPDEMDRVHQLFINRGTTAVKSVHTAMRQYASFSTGHS